MRHCFPSSRFFTTILTIATAAAVIAAAAPDSERPAWDATVLPESVDLRPSFDAFDLTPRVQGDRGTCSAFVVVQAIEFALAKLEGRGGNRLSVEFLNWASNDVNGDSADGGFFSHLWDGFASHGISTEATMPYRASYDAGRAPTDAARSEAEQHHAEDLRLHWIKEWDPTRGLTDDQLQEVKETLASGWPVGGGLLWPREAIWTDGLLQIVTRDQVFDGHSILLVGYRDDPSMPGGGAFLIRNSGGPSRDGRLTYEYVLTYMNDAVWIDYTNPAQPARWHPPSQIT